MMCSIHVQSYSSDSYSSLDVAPDSGYSTIQAENSLVKQQVVSPLPYTTNATSVALPTSQPPSAYYSTQGFFQPPAANVPQSQAQAVTAATQIGMATSVAAPASAQTTISNTAYMQNYVAAAVAAAAAVQQNQTQQQTQPSLPNVQHANYLSQPTSNPTQHQTFQTYHFPAQAYTTAAVASPLPQQVGSPSVDPIAAYNHYLATSGSALGPPQPNNPNSASTNVQQPCSSSVAAASSSTVAPPTVFLPVGVNPVLLGVMPVAAAPASAMEAIANSSQVAPSSFLGHPQFPNYTHLAGMTVPLPPLSDNNHPISSFLEETPPPLSHNMPASTVVPLSSPPPYPPSAASPTAVLIPPPSSSTCFINQQPVAVPNSFAAASYYTDPQHQLLSSVVLSENMSPAFSASAANQEVAYDADIASVDQSDVQIASQQLQYEAGHSLPVSIVSSLAATECDKRTDSLTSTVDSCGEMNEGGPESDRKLERKKTAGKRRKTLERIPKLTVLRLDGSMVECQLETSKQKTVTFVFDSIVMVPDDIANNLVVSNLLPDQHAELFVKQLVDVVRQLKEAPDRLPVVSVESCMSPSTARKRADPLMRCDSKDCDPTKKNLASDVVSDAGGSPSKRLLQTALSAPPMMVAPQQQSGLAAVQPNAQFMISPVQDAQPNSAATAATVSSQAPPPLGVSVTQNAVTSGVQPTTVPMMSMVPPLDVQQTVISSQTQQLASASQSSMNLNQSLPQTVPPHFHSMPTLPTNDTLTISQQQLFDLAAYLQSAGLDPSVLPSSVRGSFPPSALADLALLQQKLAYLSMQVTGETMMPPSYMYPPSAAAPAPGPPYVNRSPAAPPPGQTSEPMQMPLPGMPQTYASALASGLPTYLPVGVSYPNTTSSPIPPNAAQVDASSGNFVSEAGRPQYVQSPITSDPPTAIPQVLNLLQDATTAAAAAQRNNNNSIDINQWIAAVQSAQNGSSCARMPHRRYSAVELGQSLDPSALQQSMAQQQQPYYPHSVALYPPSVPGIPEVPGSPPSPRKTQDSIAAAAAKAAAGAEDPRQRKTAAAINLENLDHELRKLHSQGNVAMMRRDVAAVPSTTTVTQSCSQQPGSAQALSAPVSAVNIVGLVDGVVPPVGFIPVIDGVQESEATPPPQKESVSAPTSRISRFRVSLVSDDPLKVVVKDGHIEVVENTECMESMDPQKVEESSISDKNGHKDDTIFENVQSEPEMSASSVTLSSEIDSEVSIQAFRKATRSFSVPSPNGGNHIPSARVNPLIHPALPPSTSDVACSVPSLSNTLSTCQSCKAIPAAISDASGIKPLSKVSQISQSTVEVASSNLEIALAQIMKGAFSNLAAAVQNAMVDSTNNLAIARSPVEFLSAPSSPSSSSQTNPPEFDSKKQSDVPVALSIVVPSRRDAGVQTDRPPTKNVAINTPRPVNRAPTQTSRAVSPTVNVPYQVASRSISSNLQKTKSETTLHLVGLQQSSGASGEGFNTAGNNLLNPHLPIQRGLSLQVPMDPKLLQAQAPVTTPDAPSKLNRYPSMADLTRVGLNSNDYPVVVLPRAKSFADVSQLGHHPTSSSEQCSPPGSIVSSNASSPVELLPNGRGGLLGSGMLSKARSMWDISHNRTASAGDIPLSQLAHRNSIGGEDPRMKSPPSSSSNRPASISDVSQLGFLPRSKNMIDYGRAVPLGQFLSALAADENRKNYGGNNVSNEPVIGVNDFFTDENFKYILARQQKEREDLDMRHKVEIENFCRRRKQRRQHLNSAEEPFLLSDGSRALSPPKSPVLPSAAATASGAAPNGISGPRQRVLSPNSTIPQSPSSSFTCPVACPTVTSPARSFVSRSYSEGMPKFNKPKTFTDDLLRMVTDLGSKNRMSVISPSPSSSGSRDGGTSDYKMTLNQIKSQMRHMTADDLSTMSPQGSPSSIRKGLLMTGVVAPPQSPPSPSSSHAGGSQTCTTSSSSLSQLQQSQQQQQQQQIHYQNQFGSSPPLHPQFLHLFPGNVYPKQGMSWSGLPPGMDARTFLQMAQMQQQYQSQQPPGSSTIVQPPTITTSNVNNNNNNK